MRCTLTYRKQLITLSVVCCMLFLAPATFGSIIGTIWNGHKVLEFRGGVRWDYGLTFQNIPESFRAIPKHPGDWWIFDCPYQDSTLPSSTLSWPNRNDGELSIMISPLVLVAGGIIYSYTSAQHSNTFERNQYGKPDRGIGTSLRYYRTTGPRQHQLGLVVEVRTPWVKVTPANWLRLVFGRVYDTDGYPLMLESGWDRWDQNQVWKEEKIFTIYAHRLYAGLILGNKGDHGENPIIGYLMLGCVWPQFEYRRESAAGDMIMHHNDGPRFIIQFGINI